MPLLFIYLMQFEYVDLQKIGCRTLYPLELAAIDSNPDTINYGSSKFLNYIQKIQSKIEAFNEF